MANKINMYRQYDEEMEQQAGVAVDIAFFYRENDMPQPLQETVDYEYKTLLNNERESWDYGQYGFGLAGSVTINDTAALFGIDKLVQADAVLGLALQWMSKQSSQRGIIPIGVVTNTVPQPLTVSFEHYFEPDLLFGEVHVSVVLYLKQPSASTNGGQASLQGTILGVIEDKCVILDGEGSTFPIVVVNEPDKPLWYVDFNYSEPLIEPFEKDYIAIYLNRAHPAFTAVQNPSNPVEMSLYVSMLAGALQLILQNLMQCAEWSDIQIGENCEEGSIGQVIHYFLTTFNWELDTPEKLAMSLHKDLEARVKAGLM